MRALRGWLLGTAVFQGLSTLVGMVELALVPQWFAPMLAGTAFAERTGLAALLLGVVVGGPQWAAVVVHMRYHRWMPTAHAVAGTIMLGWIAGECLVLDSFAWMHALWGGVGAIQVLAVASLLGPSGHGSPRGPSSIEAGDRPRPQRPAALLRRATKTTTALNVSSEPEASRSRTSSRRAPVGAEHNRTMAQRPAWRCSP